jgi:hypothetical protein
VLLTIRFRSTPSNKGDFLLDRNDFACQHLPPGSLHRSASNLAVDLDPPAFDRPRRCDPTEEELIHQSLDLSSQVNLAVSQIDREIIDHISRDRNRRLFPNETNCTDC